MEISGVVRIGDYIALRNSKPNDGWLCSEGLISDELFVVKARDDFDDCLWEIHVQNQYSAMKEYDEALQSGSITLDHNESDDHTIAIGTTERTAELLHNLHRAAINEQRLNEKLMALKIGKPVAFGDLIQLRHIKSKKFMTVSTSTLAKHERENMRVSLQARGDSSSSMMFMPRYKYDREGQFITNNTDVFLRVHERPGEYIHAAKKTLSGHQDQRREINCSLETSAWSMCIYQQAREFHNSTIMAGQLVCLQDPDSTSYLSLRDQIPAVTEECAVHIMPTLGSLLTSGSSLDRQVGTYSLWLIEKSPVTSGGPISIGSDRVTLRDLNSGLFISSDEEGLRAVRGRDRASAFEISSQSPDAVVLQEGISVQLSVDGLWLCPPSSTKQR